MELKDYNKLRDKISKKDFEGKNKILDMWLYNATYFANAISIFFAFFLLFPALQNAFIINIGNETVANVGAGLFSVGFLVVFEVIKRFLIRNFSFDYVWRNFGKVVTKTVLWFILVIIIVSTSFYLSMSGARNFASGFEQERVVQTLQMGVEIERLRDAYDKRIEPYESENRTLSELNIEYRRRMAELPDDYLTARREFQQFIRENEETIRENREIIDQYRVELENEILKMEDVFVVDLEERKVFDVRTIFLFAIIVLLNESLIVLGIYFREYYEHKLYLINNKQHESLYLRKKYYKNMLRFLYGGGLLGPGDDVTNISKLKEELLRKGKIENPEKFVNDFIGYLKTTNVFVGREKKRNKIKIAKSYEDALNTINSLTDNIVELNINE